MAKATKKPGENNDPEREANASRDPADLLRALESAPIRTLPVKRIKTDVRLQARLLPVLQFDQREHAKADMERHAEAMAQRISEGLADDIPPILVALTEGEALHVIDGHHRLQAFKQAGRTEIKARCLPMLFVTAGLVCQRVNLDRVTLALDPLQLKELAWQEVLRLTEKGTKDLPPGSTYRTIAAMFRMPNGHQTVANMMKRAKAISSYLTASDSDPFSSPACPPWPNHLINPITGEPTWKAAKKVGRKNPFEGTDPSTLDDARIGQAVKDIRKLYDKHGAARIVAALRAFCLDAISANCADDGSPEDAAKAGTLSAHADAIAASLGALADTFRSQRLPS